MIDAEMLKALILRGLLGEQKPPGLIPSNTPKAKDVVNAIPTTSQSPYRKPPSTIGVRG